MKSILRLFKSSRSGRWAVVQTAFANAAIQALNVASGVLTARTLGPAGRGALAGVIMWPQFLAYAMTIGMPVASVYWLKRRPEIAQSIVGVGTLLGVFFGLLAAVIGVLVIPYSLHTYPHNIVRVAQLWATVTPLELLAVMLIAHAQAAGAFGKYNAFRFLSPLSVLVVLVVERLTGHLTYGTAACAYLLAGLPAMVWIGLWSWRHHRPTFTPLLSTSRLLLGYGVRAWGSDLLGTIANQMDRILVIGLLNPEAMGLYIVAQSAAGVLSILPTAVAPVTLPSSSGLSREGILALTGSAVRATLFVMILASLPLLVMGGFLIHLVYGSSFVLATAVLPFLVAETIADGLTAVLSQAFLAAGYPGTVTISQGCGLLTSIPMLYLLIPRFGLRGAGCALMISTLCRFVFVLLNFPLRLRSRPPKLIIRRHELSDLLGRVIRAAPAK